MPNLVPQSKELIMWRVKHFLEVTAVEQIILAYQHLQIINPYL